MRVIKIAPARRLFQHLMKKGGSLTLLQIAKKSADGNLLSKARKELGADFDRLIVIEQGRGKRGRPAKRAVLTMAGWSVADRLCPGASGGAKRLPTDVLKLWVWELGEEGDTWAKQFEQDAADARELKRLRSIGWIRPPLKKRGMPKGSTNAGSFKPGWNHPGALSLSQDAEHLNQPTYAVPPTAPRWTPPPAPPKTARDEFFENYQMQQRICAESDRRQSYVPRDCKPAPPPDPEIARIKQKAIRLHMQDAIRHDGMLYDNRVITFAEWDANVQG